ncbi:MAG: RNA polymerase sigma factor [Spirochaetaceae bacterium]
MNEKNKTENRELQDTYNSEKKRLEGKVLRLGRTLEEAEDFVHDIFTEIMDRFPIVSEIKNLPALVNWLFKRRLIDKWRHDQVKEAAGEVNIPETILHEIINAAQLNPLDEFVQDCLMDTLNEAIDCLPIKQKVVIEGQVYEGLTFKEISEITGESINTLMARKRYAIKNLSNALKSWIKV